MAKFFRSARILRLTKGNDLSSDKSLGRLNEKSGGAYGTIFATFSYHHRQKCSVSSSSCENRFSFSSASRTSDLLCRIGRAPLLQEALLRFANVFLSCFANVFLSCTVLLGELTPFWSMTPACYWSTTNSDQIPTRPVNTGFYSFRTVL
jgi:hypothetical protein